MHGIYHLVGRDRLIRNHCWERQSHAASCLLPGRVALGLEHFLTRREIALQPVAAILLCFGTPSPVPGLTCAFLFCLSMWLIGPQACPQLFEFQTHMGDLGPSPAAEKGFTHHLPVLLWAVEWDPLTTGDGCWLLQLLLLCLFTGGSVVPSRACVSSFLATLTPANHAVGWHPGTAAAPGGRQQVSLLHNCRNETTAEGKKSPLREHVTQGWLWLSWEGKYKPESVREK